MNAMSGQKRLRISSIAAGRLKMESPFPQLWGEPRSSLIPVLAELERFFLAYRVWFNQKLPRPVITIQTAGRKSVLGWYAHKRWQQAQLGNLLPEINMCPEHL